MFGDELVQEFHEQIVTFYKETEIPIVDSIYKLYHAHNIYNWLVQNDTVYNLVLRRKSLIPYLFEENLNLKSFFPTCKKKKMERYTIQCFNMPFLF